jgi:HSP20 family protein
MTESSANQEINGYLSPQNLEQLMNGYYTPLTDIKETVDYTIIEIELPGVSTKDIDVEIGNGTLDVRGQHNEDTRHRGEPLTIIRKERIYGKFKKTIPIERNISGHDVKASFKEGLLVIEIPKPKKTEITKKQKIKLFH